MNAARRRRQTSPSPVSSGLQDGPAIAPAMLSASAAVHRLSHWAATQEAGGVDESSQERVTVQYQFGRVLRSRSTMRSTMSWSSAGEGTALPGDAGTASPSANSSVRCMTTGAVPPVTVLTPNGEWPSLAVPLR